MKIVSLNLIDFVPFKDSGIRRFDATFTENIQLIIGRNGSGKSTLCAQLSPLPPARSIFGKKGLKSLVIDHDGQYFKLESEFEKHSSPHLFIDGDEENLNVGRTTQSQNELILTHLGITPLIDDLMMNRYQFPKWTVSRRKDFLMNVNPDQLGFVLVEQKKISSKIRACKNNLSRLNDRKMTIEQDMLNDDHLLALRDEHTRITRELAFFQEQLLTIDIALKTMSQSQGGSLSMIPHMKSSLKTYRQEIRRLSDVVREDRERQFQREDCLQRIAVLLQKQQDNEQKIIDLSHDLIDLEARYNDLSPDGNLDEISANITRLEIQRDRLQTTKPPFELSKDDLQQKQDEWFTIQEKLMLFQDLSVTLYPRKKRQHRDRMLSQAQYKQSSYRMKLSDLATQLDSLTKRHSISPQDIPTDLCSKDKCPLYAHFMGEFSTTEHKRQELRRHISWIERRLARLDLYVHALQTWIETTRPYMDRIQWLVSLAQQNPILNHVLRQMDVLNVVSTTPMRICLNLNDAYSHIAQWIKYKDVLSDLDTVYTLKNRLISSESHDTIKLVSNIAEKKNTLQKLRTDNLAISLQYKDALDKKERIETFDRIKAAVFQLKDMIDAAHQQFETGHEVEKLMYLKTKIEELRHGHFGRMSEITTTLKHQDSLKDRYDQEVMSQIGIIEQELDELIHIEKALAEIPKKNMINFINTIFDQANRFIQMVWTVPLHIEYLTMEHLLNYEFYVSGDNNSIREMNECSEGQLEIISLAINLALRVILKHTDYPIILDECGRTFDDKHRQNLITLLKRLIDDKVISQMFIVNHDALIHAGFTNSETIVLNDANVLLPQTYNQGVTIS